MAAPKKSTAMRRRKSGVIRAQSDFFRTARYGLTLQEYRVIYYAILAGQQDKKPFEPVTISVRDFKELCGLKGKSPYSTLRNISKRIVGKSVEIGYKDADGLHFKQATWLTDITYHAREGKVTITPNKALQPFFEGKPFTQTEYYFLVKFTCQYSERLYEILKTFDNKTIADFKIDDLRARLAVTEGKYPNYADLKRFVLEPAMKDINEFTDLSLDFREKRGMKNKVETIVFSIHKKKVLRLAARVQAGEYQPPLSDTEQEAWLNELIGEPSEGEDAPLHGQLMLDGGEVE